MANQISRQELLSIYQHLRVADVRDGMDAILLHHQGSMTPDIKPLWRTRAFGIARTVHCIPFTGEIPKDLTPEQYQEWSDWYYQAICPYPWIDDIIPGDLVVIDQSGVDAGMMGSNNTLAGMRRGAKGYVSNGGVRDTDELVLQKVPFWAAFMSQKMVQGRLQYHCHNVPILVGGVIVNPGDVVVADGDGVIVVPQSAAMEVARLALAERKRDMRERKDHYSALGLPLDETIWDEK